MQIRGEAGDPMVYDLGPESFKLLNELHGFAHPGQEGGVYHRDWNGGGCTKVWCMDVLPEYLPTYQRTKKANPTRVAQVCFACGALWSSITGVMFQMELHWLPRSLISIGLVALFFHITYRRLRK